MKTLLAIVVAFSCSILSNDCRAEDEISREDIAATVRHMQAIIHAQTGELAEEKRAHEAAEVDLMELQSQVDGLTSDRNAQAAKADVALDQLAAATAELAANAKELRTLKQIVAGAAGLLAMALCLMLGLASKGVWGIVATFVVIPAAVGGAVFLYL